MNCTHFCCSSLSLLPNRSSHCVIQFIENGCFSYAIFHTNDCCSANTSQLSFTESDSIVVDCYRRYMYRVLPIVLHHNNEFSWCYADLSWLSKNHWPILCCSCYPVFHCSSRIKGIRVHDVHYFAVVKTIFALLSHSQLYNNHFVESNWKFRILVFIAAEMRVCLSINPFFSPPCCIRACRSVYFFFVLLFYFRIPFKPFPIFSPY